MAFSPDGRRLATGGTADRRIVLWDLHTGAGEMMPENGSGPAQALAFSPDGALLASAASFDYHVRLWDPGSRLLVRDIAGHARSVNSLAFSPDGVLLATASNDGMLGLWTVATCQRRVFVDVHATWLRPVAFSPDERSLVLATGNDDDLRFWDLPELLGTRLDRTRRR